MDDGRTRVEDLKEGPRARGAQARACNTSKLTEQLSRQAPLRRRGKRSALGGLLGARVRVGQDAFGDQPRILPDRGFDFSGDVGIVLEILRGTLAALPDAVALERVPGSRLVDEPALALSPISSSSTAIRAMPVP